MPLNVLESSGTFLVPVMELSLDGFSAGIRVLRSVLRNIFCLLVLAAVSSSAAFAAGRRLSDNQFLIASDLHFNPMADASLVKDLAAAEPEQWETILMRSKSTAFSQYGQDTNWWLLKSSLDAMRATLPHPAFILVTGDLLAHHFPQTFRTAMPGSEGGAYRSFVLKTVQFLAIQLRRRFPDAGIFLTPGNNDENCGNYSIRAGGLFLHDTADVVRSLAKEDGGLTRSWQQFGSYDVPNPALKGVRIISVNTVFFSEMYHAAKFDAGCAAVASGGPPDLFAWLQARLAQAQQAHEKVWLIFHIPPGMDGYSTIQQFRSLQKTQRGESAASLCASSLVPMWMPKWTAQFDDLLEKYHSTVIASFAGHTHNDDFRVINASGSGPAFVLISPAISPIYNENPAFRVVTFNRAGAITDTSVYFLTNLVYASATTPGEWKREYRFSEQWKLAAVNTKSLSTLYQRIQSSDSDRAEWLKLYNVSSSAAYLAPGTTPGLYCAIEALEPESYQSCYCSRVAGTSSSASSGGTAGK